MKTANTLLTLLLAVTAIVPVQGLAGDKGVKDSQLGLEKSDVFSAPSPKAFRYSDNFPGMNDRFPRSYPGAPPQIPHDIEAFLPVSAARNMCLNCHKRPAGKIEKGQPTAIPDSHYTDLRADRNGKPGEDVIGARQVCTQCHVPQAQVSELTGNEFGKQ